MHTITFHPSWSCWGHSAGEALRGGVPPAELVWVPDEHDAQAVLPLTDAGSSPTGPAAPGSIRAKTGEDARLPRDFERYGELVACHRRDDRFALLYRLLWRLRHGEAELLADLLDPEVFRFRRMAAAVRDDLKETRSRLRLQDPAWLARTRKGARPAPLPDLVGWCEPHHRVVPLLARELAERHPQRTFALLSPTASAFWDGNTLELGAGASRTDAYSVDALASRWEKRRRVAA